MTGFSRSRSVLFALSIGISLMFTRPAAAHCDAMDGPVVTEALAAIKNADVTPLLKWVSAEQEDEIRQVFDRAQRVRHSGEDARELADTHFLETLVRLHRASEGAPYTGLKPAGSSSHPAITATDSALKAENIDQLVSRLQHAVEREVRQRFDTAVNAKNHPANDVEAGRHAVHAYVELVHYVKALHDTITSPAHGHTDNHGHSGTPSQCNTHGPCNTQGQPETLGSPETHASPADAAHAH